jgi:hypothetical protein
MPTHINTARDPLISQELCCRGQSRIKSPPECDSDDDSGDDDPLTVDAAAEASKRSKPF